MFRPGLVKPVIVSMIDDNVIQGSITLKGPNQRISDFFIHDEEKFVTIFNIEDGNRELMVVNKNHIV